jgi:hypothetical protein
MGLPKSNLQSGSPNEEFERLGAQPGRACLAAQDQVLKAGQIRETACIKNERWLSQ